MTGLFKAKTLQFLYRVTPPVLFDAMLTMAGKRKATRGQTYQGMRTDYDAAPLHVGRYGESYDRYWSLDPHIKYNHVRYRYYNVAMAAQLAREAAGDYLCIGVAYGVAPRILYDVAELERFERTLHLVDPFTAIWNSKSAWTRSFYHNDPTIVTRQYPHDARVQIHRGLAPDILPLRGVSRIAFAYLDTSDEFAETASLQLIWPQLSPGGVMIIDRYGADDGFFNVYDPVFEKLGITPFWFPSGQAMLIKPRS
jgi:O-methyltransferase